MSRRNSPPYDAAGFARQTQIHVACSFLAVLSVQRNHADAVRQIRGANSQFEHRRPLIRFIEHRRIEHVHPGFAEIFNLMQVKAATAPWESIQRRIALPARAIVP